MQTIIDFFKTFIDIVVSIVDFVIQLFSDLIYVVGLLGEFVLRLPDFFGWLPSVAVTLLISTFTIVVIYKVLGREG